MSLAVSISTNHFALNFGGYGENIRVGPVDVYLGWSMQGIVWKGRFDFLCEKTDHRPESGKWFETWTDSYGARNGYLLGRQWRLVPGQRQQSADHTQDIDL